METRKGVLRIMLGVFLLSGCVFCTKETSKQKKVVFIILDGISADAFEDTNTPHLDEISNIGGYTRAYMGGEKGAYSQTPTISAVGYNSLLTGSWANKHNVWGNSIKAPNYHYWNLFRIAKKHNPAIKTAIFSTWLDNRTKLVGEGLKEAGDITMDYAFDGFELDTISFPHDPEKKYLYDIDEHVSKEAKRYIIDLAPDLSWVYLEYTDAMGHKHGDSPPYQEAIIAADNQVGRVWEAIKKREKEFDEDWMIVVTTDHGRKLPDGKGHGGQSERERSVWIVTNHKNTNAYFQNLPGTVDIMPSLLKHMDIKIPERIVNEIDGTSFIGNIAVSNLKVNQEENKLNLTWKSYGENEPATIFISTTNHYGSGGEDSYKKMADLNSTDKSYTLDISELPSDYYKIMLKTQKNSVNYWIVNKNINP